MFGRSANGGSVGTPRLSSTSSKSRNSPSPGITAMTIPAQCTNCARCSGSPIRYLQRFRQRSKRGYSSAAVDHDAVSVIEDFPVTVGEENRAHIQDTILGNDKTHASTWIRSWFIGGGDAVIGDPDVDDGPTT